MMLGDQVVGNDSSECVAKLGAVDPELLALVDKDIGPSLLIHTPVMLVGGSLLSYYTPNHASQTCSLVVFLSPPTLVPPLQSTTAVSPGARYDMAYDGSSSFSGVTGRAICYSHLLVPGEGYDTLDTMCFESQNLATWQGALFQAGPFRRVVYAKMSKAMVKSPEYIEKCRDRLAAALDTIATMLDQPEFALPGQGAAANAKPGPTATGITVASLLYPVVFPPEIQRVIFGEGSTVGSLEEMPQALQDEFKRWRATKAGTWCLQYYAAYRLESLSKI
jgi:hypothetical protein